MDVERLLGTLLSNGLSKKALSKSVRRAAFSTQGITLLAGIGIAAWEHFRDRQLSPSPAAAGSGSTPAAPPPFPGTAAAGPATPPPFPGMPPAPPPPEPHLMLLAMVQAAKADGDVDEEERRDILDYLDRAGLGEADLARLNELLSMPLDLDGLVARVRDPATAAEVWAASRLAIDPDHPAEQTYLDLLAQRLGLDQDAVRAIEARLDAAGTGSAD